VDAKPADGTVRGQRMASYLRLVLIAALALLPSCKEFERGGASDIIDEQAYEKTLGELRGKVVLLDFWATWCGPCRNEIPHEVELHRQFKGRPFEILGVSRDDDRKALSNFLSGNKLPWPNVFDEHGKIVNQWGVQGFPTFILIDHNGAVLERWVGGGHINQIRAAVDKAVRAAEKK
jgi:thiol-disulfide isomerase/thioredoxin